MWSDIYYVVFLSGIEELCSKREELNRQIKQEEDEKDHLQHDIRVLSEKLSRVNESLSRRLTARTALDRTIAETEAAYTKVGQVIPTLTLQKSTRTHRTTRPFLVSPKSCLYALKYRLDLIGGFEFKFEYFTSCR